MVDPGGNWIRIDQPGETSGSDEDSTIQYSLSTKLSRATHATTLLSDAGHDDRAAQMLDAALAQGEPASAIDRVQTLVLRAAVAITLGDQPVARRLLSEVRGTPLREDEHDILRAELQRAEDLEHFLQ